MEVLGDRGDLEASGGAIHFWVRAVIELMRAENAEHSTARQILPSNVAGVNGMPEPQIVAPDAPAEWTESLLRHFPHRSDAIARGWELVRTLTNCADELSRDNADRFMHREVALIGDSLYGIRFSSRDGDFNTSGAYFRVAIGPGETPSPPNCVHYEVLVLGTVAGIVAPFRMAALIVPSNHYIFRQTF